MVHIQNRLPRICCVHQKICTDNIEDIKAAILKKLDAFNLKNHIAPKDSVAITASSRGIPGQALILKTLVAYLKDLDAIPFIIPAMGSHGGGTEGGQLTLLEEYGITEQTIGCPIKASMDVEEIGVSDLGHPIYIDKYAAAADKIIIFNKISSHSKFFGEVESGLSKMCLMGLGKKRGAKFYHRLVDQYGWSKVVNSIREYLIQQLPIICGIAVILNIRKEIAKIRVLHPNEFKRKEPELLKECKELTELLPVKEFDLLIIDEMGKNIFGTGMNTNLTGKKSGTPFKIRWVFVRDLTKETNGNAQGIGLADFTTKKLVDKIDFSQTYLNALTAFRTDSPKIPIFLENDQKVLETILNLADIQDPSALRLMWIKNTLELEKIIVSEYFFKEVDSRDDLTFIGKPETIEFDTDGFLINSKKYW